MDCADEVSFDENEQNEIEEIILKRLYYFYIEKNKV